MNALSRIPIVLFLGLALFIPQCATDTVMTQKNAAEQRKHEVEAAKKQKQELEEKLNEAMKQLEDQAEEQEKQSQQ